MKLVRESIAFERGKDPKKSLGFGIEAEIEDWLKNVYKNPQLIGEWYSIAQSILSSAPEEKKLGWFKWIIENYVPDVNEEKGALLARASADGEKEIVEYLLSMGADPHLWDERPLAWACDYANNFEVIKLLVDAGANVNHSDNNYTPLIDTIKMDELKSAQYLIDHGADVNIKNGAPLKYFCRGAQWAKSAASDLILRDYAKFLIDNGADVNISDEIIFEAFVSRNIPLIKLLIEKGVDVNSADGYPLKRAIQMNNEKLVRLLLDNGAKVSQHHLPLAYKKQNEKIIKLIEQNAKNLKLKETDTPDITKIKFFAKENNVSFGENKNLTPYIAIDVNYDNAFDKILYTFTVTDQEKPISLRKQWYKDNKFMKQNLMGRFNTIEEALVRLKLNMQKELSY